MRLGGLPHEIVAKTVHKILPGSVRVKGCGGIGGVCESSRCRDLGLCEIQGVLGLGFLGVWGPRFGNPVM